MKKTIVLVISFIVLFSTVFSFAYADSDNSYYIKEFDMSISIPKEFVVFTRDIKSDDPNLAKFGVTRDSLVSNMKARDNYLDALTEDRQTEIYICINKNIGIDEFSSMSDAMLKEVARALYSELQNQGVTVTKDEVYHHSQTTFIKLYGSYSISGTTTHIREYCTVYGGNLIMITMASYAGPISASYESGLQSAIDSIRFDSSKTSTSPEPSQTASSSSFMYTDQKTGLQFTVPAGWKEEPLSKKRNTIDAKFVSETDIFAHIFYGSIDMWESIPESEKSGLSRADVNSSLFSSEEIEAILGSYYSGSTAVSISNVKTVTYNGIEYYYLESETSSNGITLPITQLIRIDNGYTYLFQYYGTRDSDYYTDFKNLMNSAVYTATPVAAVTAAPSATAKPTATVKPVATAKPVATEKPYATIPSQVSNYNRNSANAGMWATIIGIALWALVPGFIARKKGRSFAGYYFLSFLITPLVTMIITLCLKDRNKESEKSCSVKQDVVPAENPIVPQPAQKNGMEDNEFLHKVPSTKVPAEPLVSSAPATSVQPLDDLTISIQESDNNPDELESNQAVVPAEAVDNDIPAAEPEQEGQSLLFCRYCGFKLLDNSEFCSHCGKKVR